ncbi:MAG: CheF family chemotaxis protein [Methanoculleaceae archaeon]
MKQIPVKINVGGEWIGTKMGIDLDHLSLSEPVEVNLPFTGVVDLREDGNRLTITPDEENGTPIEIATVEKARKVMKRLILEKCHAYRLNAYFISPAIIGGVLITDPVWEKGAIAVLKSCIWLYSPNIQVNIPLDEVVDIELTTREIQERELKVVKIDHLQDKEVVGTLVLCPISTLEILYNFLKEAIGDFESGLSQVGELGEQVAMLVYSGMDSHGIEQMLNLTHAQLDHIYDRLLEQGLAEVVMTRRELQLTPRGVRLITSSMKQS